MNDASDEDKLIKAARAGDEDSIGLLIGNIRPRLEQFVFRNSLDHHETQDIVQESLISMAKCLGKLEKSDKFWPWLRRIALNKLKDHRRKEKRNRDLSQKSSFDREPDKAKGLANLISEELSEAVMESMKSLKTEHRQVLILRCYEDMRYPEIAEEMGRSEFGVRMLFRRAKSALQKKLAKNGIGKGALVSSLVLFGKLTSKSEAAGAKVNVTSQTLKAGALATAASTVTSGTFVAALSLAAVGAVSTALICPYTQDNQSQAKAAIDRNPGSAMVYMPNSYQMNESWHFYPYGEDGPVILKYTERDTDSGKAGAQWIMNQNGNYYYDRSDNTLNILNHRFINKGMLTKRLPADSEALNNSLDRIEGVNTFCRFYNFDSQPGLMFMKAPGGQGNLTYRADIYPNALREGYFSVPERIGVRKVDLRDDLHKQGWAYFSVKGRISGNEVSGCGRIPFVLSTYRENYPWVYLKYGRRDYYAQKDNYPEMLSRPWEGLHSMDIIRRDLAQKDISFDISTEESGNLIRIIFERSGTTIHYLIDIERDLVETIVFRGKVQGRLEFDYSRMPEAAKDIDNENQERLISILQIIND